MFKPIQFPEEVESLVRFVEETAPDSIIEETLSKLRGGVEPIDLIRAAALAVVRSTDLPPEHHGGPVHPICGVHGVYNTSRRFNGENAYIPIIQHVSLCNHHVNSPSMGPYIMPEIAPRDGLDDESYAYHVTYRPPADTKRNALSTTKEAFVRNMKIRQPISAEQYCSWLLDKTSPGEVLDLVLPIALTRNNIDDHYFLYPLFTYRALDILGWEWAPVLMRPVVRYMSRKPFALYDLRDNLQYSLIEELLEKYKLLEIDIPANTSDRETDAIGELAHQIGTREDFSEIAEQIAQALSKGLSLEGAGEALSIGASLVFLRSNYGNPMDSHLNTGSNARRYLLKMEGVSLKNKLLALMTGISGPECIISEEMLVWNSEPSAEEMTKLPDRSQEELLDAIQASIEGLPLADWAEVGLDEVRAPHGAKDTINLAKQYCEKGYNPMTLFERIGKLVWQDDYTELHSIKQHQAILDEFYTTREPFRWAHLVAAAKEAAIVYCGRQRGVYQATRQLLEV